MRNEKLKLAKFNILLAYLKKEKLKRVGMLELRDTYIFNALYFKDYINEFVEWANKQGAKVSIEKGKGNEKFLVVR